MTIKEFWKEVNSRVNLAEHRMPLQQYAANFHKENGRCLTVGVDVFQWISQLNKSTDLSLEGTTDGFEKIIVRGILSKVRTLRESFVNIVLIFDGKIKPGKHEDIYSNEIFEDVYFLIQNRVKNDEHIIHSEIIKQITSAFKAENMDYHFAVGDGEVELARLNQAGIIDAIISNDGDSLAYGAKVLLRNYSGCLEDIPFARIRGRKNSGTINSRTMYVTVIDEKVLNLLELNTMKIMFISLVQGDDYSSGILNIGIKKAWNLATKTCGDWNPVTELRNIYVDNDDTKYLQAILPYNFIQRKQLLEKYLVNLNDYIQKYSKELFGQKFNQKLSFLNDSVLAHHFYPQLAPFLYDTMGFQINIINETGKLYPKIVLPVMPQPLSIKKISSNEVFIKCGNDACGKLTYKKFIDFKSNVTSVASGRNSWDWFKTIDFLSVLTYCRQFAPFDNFFVNFSKSYLWMVIVNMHNFGFTLDDIFIKKESKGYYQVQYKPRLIFKRFMNLPDNPVDENGKIVPEKTATMFIPEYMFNKDQNGKKLLRHYRKSREATKTCTPRKNKLPPQKTTLDSLSKSPKSPFKIHLIPNNLLLTSATKTEISSKRDIDNVTFTESSPKKKIKGFDTFNTSVNAGGVGIFTEPFVEDAEISKILQEDTTNSFLDDEFDIFMKSNKQEETEHNDSSIIEIEKLPLPNNKLSQHTWGKNFENLRKKERKSNTVLRGASLTDAMTSLPDIPKEPIIDTNKKDAERSDNSASASDASYEFSSLDISDSDLVPPKQKVCDSDRISHSHDKEIDKLPAKNILFPKSTQYLKATAGKIDANTNSKTLDLSIESAYTEDRNNKKEKGQKMDTSYEFSSFDFSDADFHVTKPITGTLKKTTRQTNVEFNFSGNKSSGCLCIGDKISATNINNDESNAANIIGGGPSAANIISGSLIMQECINGDNLNTEVAKDTQKYYRKQIKNDVSDGEAKHEDLSTYVEAKHEDLSTHVEAKLKKDFFNVLPLNLLRGVTSSFKQQQENDIGIDANNIYTEEDYKAIVVPDGCDDGGLMLAESTDDEEIWVLK